MKRTRWLAWILVAVWAAWLYSAQGALVARVARPEWVPDLALALLVALGARVATRDMPKLACAIALARCAVSVEPPSAVFAAALLAVAVVRASRGVIELTGPVPRSVLALLCAELVHAWFSIVHDVRVAQQSAQFAALAPHAVDVAGAFARAWPTALATALASLFLGPALARLPGTSPLTLSRQWHVVASFR